MIDVSALWSSLPVPAILLDPDDMIAGQLRDGHVLLVLGETHGHLGQSALLAEVYGRVEGDAPNVDLDAEKAHGDFIRDNHSWITACTDLSDGGLALAAFEMAEAAGVGVTLYADDTPTLFGEDQGRYLIGCNFDKAEALMIAGNRAGVTITTVGKAGGDSVTFGQNGESLETLSHIYRTSFEEVVG